MKCVAGIDVGSRTTKCVVMDPSHQILAKSIVSTGAFMARAAEMALESALEEAHLDRKQIAYIASTGWGRYQVPFRDIQITDTTCHARGAVFILPSARTVIDIGAQNTRAIRVEASGRVRDFRMNNRCAAGAGRFLERTATALEISLEEMGPLSLRSDNPAPISSICAIMAESEVINLVSHEAKLEDILAGVHLSLVERIASLARQVGLEGDIILTGGVALNVGMVRTLQDYLGVKVHTSPLSLYAGAIGASLLGWKRVEQKQGLIRHEWIRNLMPEDAQRVAELESRLTGQPPMTELWKKRIQLAREHGYPALGVDVEGNLVGYLFGSIQYGVYGQTEPIGWIEFIGIDPNHQGKGFGHEMLKAALEFFKSNRIERVMTLVDEVNLDLDAFFKKEGFQPAKMNVLHLELEHKSKQS